MPNTLLNSDVIAAESLMHLVNALPLTKLVDRQWEEKFANEGGKIGDTLRLRDPVNFTVGEGAGISASLQDIEERSRTLVLDTQLHVAFTVSAKEFALNIERFSERYIKRAMMDLGNQVDRRIALLARDVPNFEGTPGTVPTELATFLSARTRMSNLGCPTDARHFVLSPAAEANMITDLRGLFESGAQIKKQYETGEMGRAIGYRWHMGQNLSRHTAGDIDGSVPLVNTANQTGSAILVDGLAASRSSVWRRGDKVTFAGVNAVNYYTKQSTGQLRQFAVTADVDSNASGQATLPIRPALTTAGPYQNVTAAPADNAVILTWGTAATSDETETPQLLAFHEKAFTCAIVPLEVPDGTHRASMKTDPDAKVGIRFVADYQVLTDMFICRFDVLCGFLLQVDDFACVIAS